MKIGTIKTRTKELNGKSAERIAVLSPQKRFPKGAVRLRPFVMEDGQRKYGSQVVLSVASFLRNGARVAA